MPLPPRPSLARVRKVKVQRGKGKKNKVKGKKRKDKTIPDGGRIPCPELKGWQFFSTVRQSGASKGQTDKYWVSAEGKQYGSLAAARRACS